MRASGILLPVSSLWSKYGIGTFSKEAYRFVDRLKAAGQSYWQILPLGATGYGDSPYQSFSTFAGNPYYIDLEELIDKGYITREECDRCDFGCDERYIDYEKIYNSRFELLKTAFRNSNITSDNSFNEFVKDNYFWLKDYALYMAVKNSFKGISWIEWEEDIRLRTDEAVKRYEKELEEEIRFYEFLQYMFMKQWLRLKEYANNNGIKIIGDIPIYVAFDSADCWSDTSLFQFDENNMPVAVAGCPPDAFSATGQLWGNPLYNWNYHEETGFEWWIKRVSFCFKLYDVVRVDHFRGFDEYYSIPYGNTTAEYGKWEKGPGYRLFERLNERLGELDIIAEDLGYLTDSVRELVKKTGYPGMKILQFAFDSREESDYLPHNYDKNCIVYTGTHDNDTTASWYKVISEEDRRYAAEYMNNAKSGIDEIPWDFIRLAMASVADTCIIPIQDYLGFYGEARINTPSTLGDNWKWRLKAEDISDELVGRIYRLTKLYGRLNG